MPTIVTIKSSARAAVISERIVDDGRERHENGNDELVPDVEQSFIVHAGQSLRVIELPPLVEPEAPVEGAAA
jgi:hypothetical protein